jgi:predicted DNA-binding transcriptional regulator AlpA
MEADHMQEDKPVFARQCAPMVGTSPGELYRMARKNIVPCQRTGVKGRGVRFIPKDVRLALQQRPAWAPSAHNI